MIPVLLGLATNNTETWDVNCHDSPQGQHCLKIMNPPQILPQQMAGRLLRAQPDSVAHVTDHSVSDRCA